MIIAQTMMSKIHLKLTASVLSLPYINFINVTAELSHSVRILELLLCNVYKNSNIFIDFQYYASYNTSYMAYCHEHQ